MRLGAGAVVQGPAIVEEIDSTTVVHPQYQVRVDEVGQMVLTAAEERVKNSTKELNNDSGQHLRLGRTCSPAGDNRPPRPEYRRERDKGTTFENLCIAYLQNDPIQARQYEQPMSYSDWAQVPERRNDRVAEPLGFYAEPERSAQDLGIDLVAKLRDEEGWCAIQCKFHATGSRIAKADIDSFLAASGHKDFRQAADHRYDRPRVEHPSGTDATRTKRCRSGGSACKNYRPAPSVGRTLRPAAKSTSPPNAHSFHISARRWKQSPAD